MKETLKYEEAMREIERIVRDMEANELDIDSLTDNLKKAQKLLAFCKDKLTKTDEEIKNLLKTDEERIRKAE